MKLHHVAEGDGPTVVLLGSLGANSSMWEPQLRALRGFRVVRVDLPGHGGSPVPDGTFTINDIADAVCELAGSPASYVGLSLGGVPRASSAAQSWLEVTIVSLMQTSLTASTVPSIPKKARPRGQ